MEKSKTTNLFLLYDKYSTEKEADTIFTTNLNLDPQLEDNINEFGTTCERQGFMAGFRAAMQLLRECRL